MGLDICIKHLYKAPQDHVLSIDEATAFCKKRNAYLLNLCDARTHKNKPDIPGLDKDCIFRAHERVFSKAKIFREIEKDCSEWEWSNAMIMNDDVISHETFYNKLTNEELTFDVTNENFKRITNDVVSWFVCVSNKDVAYMRKGANEKFYSDDMWDSPPVCLKSILKEHMEKYFNEDGDEYDYYDNSREAFKRLIYDKFKDGKNLAVCYC